MKRHKVGFTLVEIMIAIVILSVLLAIAFPSYQDYLVRSHRTEAQTGLITAAAAMEKCYVRTNTYIDCTIPTATLNETYTLSLDPDELDVDGYLLIATRAGTVVLSDTQCGDFTLSSTGERSNINAAEVCW